MFFFRQSHAHEMLVSERNLVYCLAIALVIFVMWRLWGAWSEGARLERDMDPTDDHPFSGGSAIEDSAFILAAGTRPTLRPSVPRAIH